MSAPVLFRSVEFRSTDADPGDGRTLSGYAAVFNSPTEIAGWEGNFIEEIAPGAFKRAIRSKTPVLQFDHGRDARTGTVPIGSIESLQEDNEGLFVEARLFDNPVVEPIRQAIEGKAVHGMSFRFQVAEEKWTDNAGAKVKPEEVSRLLWEPGDRGPLKRTITRIDPLHELGPVVFPAYANTTVGVRSLIDQLTPDEHRQMLREFLAEARKIGITDLASLGTGSALDGEDGTEPGNGDRPAPHTNRSRVDTDALLMRGIIRA